MSGGPCCHQRPHGYPGPRPQSVTMFVSEGCATAGAIAIWVVSTVTWGHGVIWARTTAEGLVWVYGPTAATSYCRICVDFCGSWYHQRLSRCPGTGSPPGAMLVSWGHVNLRDLCCHLWPQFLSPVCCLGLFLCPFTYHIHSLYCSWPMLPPEAMGQGQNLWQLTGLKKIPWQATNNSFEN